MMYRCPYCHADIGKTKPPRCPACGKTLRYAERRTPVEMREDRRKLRLMEKQALRKRSAFDVQKADGILQNPRKTLWVVFILAVVGWLLVKVSTSPEVRVEGFRHNVTDRHLNTLATALARYHFHTGQWPSTNTGLDALLADDGAPGWDGPYLANYRQLSVEKIPQDAWKQPYVYNIAANGAPILFSTGPDGIAGTEDDVYPNPQAFVLSDMSWTNEWVSAERRKPIIINVMPQQK